MPWRAICDVCGFEFSNTQVKKRWDGMIVCDKDYELRHPMDFLKVKPEHSQVLPWSRPEAADTFVDVTYIDTENNTIPSGTFDNSLD